MKIVLILTTILYTSLASAQIMREYPSPNRGKPTRGSNYNERTTIGDSHTNSNPSNSLPGRGKPTRGSNYNERTTIGDPYTNSNPSNYNPNNSSSTRQLPSRNRACNFLCKSLSHNIQIDKNTELAATILLQHGEDAENLLRSLGATDEDIEFLSEINATELDLQ